VTEEEAIYKNEELQNICKYCDHFFKCHKEEIFDKMELKRLFCGAILFQNNYFPILNTVIHIK
jgi:hypothetical protein